MNYTHTTLIEWIMGSPAATWVSALVALASLVVALTVRKLTRDAIRWHKFEKRAEIHRLTQEYLREAHHASFVIKAPTTQDWWRDIWVHRFLFGKDARTALDEIFESGARLEQLAEGDEGHSDKSERQKSRLFHSQRLARSYRELDRLFEPYLKFDH